MINTNFKILALSFIIISGCERMNTTPNDHGKAISANEGQVLELMQSVKWERVVNKINTGKIDQEVIIAMSTMDIPSHYDATNLQEKYLTLYKEYLVEMAKSNSNQ